MERGNHPGQSFFSCPYLFDDVVPALELVVREWALAGFKLSDKCLRIVSTSEQRVKRWERKKREGRV
eukprot:767160-Hanusia_phi.AAC.4